MARLGRGQPVRPIISQGSVAPGLPISALQDNFNDNNINTTLWPGNYGNTSETTQRAVVECATGFSGFQSARIYSLIGSEVVVQIYPPAAGGATTAAFSEIVIASDQQPTGTTITLQADALNGLVWAFLTVGGVDVGTPVSIPLTSNPIWGRIRESNGSLTWWTSTTGTPSSWGSPIRTEPTPPWVTTSAIGLIMQAHRSDGVTDFPSFDNVGLPPADPPAPGPIVRSTAAAQAFRARRLRPPSRAIIHRAPDTRPAPSYATAVGLDGALLLPITVRLQSSTVDVLLTSELRDVSWRKVIPGGDASATISLDRPLSQAAPEIEPFARVTISDARSNETLWAGELADPGRTAGSDGEVFQVTAMGPSAIARDRTFAYAPIDSSVDHWVKFGGSMASGQVSATKDPGTGKNGVKTQFAGGINVTSPNYVAAQTSRYADLGMELARVSFSEIGGGTGQWDMRAYTYPSQDLLSSNALQTSEITGISGTVTGGDWTVGDNILQLRMQRTAAGTAAPDDNAWTHFHDIVILTKRVDEEGHPVTSYPRNYILASEVVQDLLGAHMPEFDGLDAFIETTTRHITQLAYPSGVTAAQVLDDLAEAEGAYYWAAGSPVPRSGLWRFEWRRWPTHVRYEADVVDGFDSPGSTAELYDAVTVTWTDELGADQITRVTAPNPILDAAGRTRDTTISLGSETGTEDTATAAGTTFLQEHALPTNRGRLTIARPILDHDLGMEVGPEAIQPGGLIRVRGVHAHRDALNAAGRDGVTVFRIVAVSYRASDGSAELELDADAISTSQAIAALQQRQARGRGRGRR